MASVTGVSTPLSTATTAEVNFDINVTDEVPSVKSQSEAALISVYRSDGTSQLLQDVTAGQRVLVIFIRHFLCGICQQFLRSLNTILPPSSLPQDTRVVVIGCGAPDMISMYQKETNCQYLILADPSRKLYDILGMTRTLSLGSHKPEYQTKGLTTTILGSLAYGIRSGTGSLKGGDIRQIGGEFLYEGGSVRWCHRMRNTRDHAPLETLRTVIHTGSADSVRGRMQDSTSRQGFN
ncbi:MAG: hypothetical protein M1814_005582 [Vezdaea aestivalis]|nr:MAG: hypothetical protein M1814_005582 [Vezdaea aestivalis]